MPLAECKSTPHRRSGAWSDRWIERIDIETQMNGSRSVGVHVRKRELDNPADAIFVNLVHAIGANIVLAKDLFLAFVDVSETNID